MTMFQPEGVASANFLAKNWWYYRVAGDGRERPFGTYTKSDGGNLAGNSSYPLSGNGDTATYNWTESSSTGVRFTAPLHYHADGQLGLEYRDGQAVVPGYKPQLDSIERILVQPGRLVGPG